MKRIITAVLVLLMALALVVPASAAEMLEAHASETGITIDGKFSEGEWGEPLYSATPQDLLAKANEGWTFKRYTPEIPSNQHAEVYTTNDGDYIYIAARLIGGNEGAECDSINNLTNYPHLSFVLAAYSEKTTAAQILYNGQIFTQYAHYAIGLVKGEKAQISKSQGMTIRALDESDYAVTYDAESCTYTYECRVPYGNTYISVNKEPRVVMSFEVEDGKIGKASSGNRYEFSRGAEMALKGMGAYYFAIEKTDPLVVRMLTTAEMPKDGNFSAAVEEASSSAQTVIKEAAADNSMLISSIAVGVAVLFVMFTVVTAVIVKRRRGR